MTQIDRARAACGCFRRCQGLSLSESGGALGFILRLPLAILVVVLLSTVVPVGRGGNLAAGIVGDDGDGDYGGFHHPRYDLGLDTTSGERLFLNSREEEEKE